MRGESGAISAVSPFSLSGVEIILSHVLPWYRAKPFEGTAIGSRMAGEHDFP
jgi:hypothetical protein